MTDGDDERVSVGKGEEKRVSWEEGSHVIPWALCFYFLFFCQDRLFFINLKEMVMVLAFMSECSPFPSVTGIPSMIILHSQCKVALTLICKKVALRVFEEILSNHRQRTWHGLGSDMSVYVTYQLSVCAQQVLAGLQPRGRNLMQDGLGGHHGVVPVVVAAGGLGLAGWLLVVPHSCTTMEGKPVIRSEKRSNFGKC